MPTASAISPQISQHEQWNTSSFCSSTTCVEVQIARDQNLVKVRNSKDPDAPALSFDADEWRAFVAGVRNSEFDI